MAQPGYLSLYEINTRVQLHELGAARGRPATLDDMPDQLLDRLAHQGFDWIWLLGVWQTGPAGTRIARSAADVRAACKTALPDLKVEDIISSPFAVRAYTVNEEYGGNEALARLRQRLHRRGLRLMLDLVPNHTALDHRWAEDHPEYYIHGSEADLAHEPGNYCRVRSHRGPQILAHGRDPYFAGWTDTLQLNHRHPGLRAALIDELLGIAGLCDGVRCDMAMLLLPDVIEKTWGERARPADGAVPVDTPFWPQAAARVRRRSAEFVLLAEAYWGKEWTLQQQGFDYTYDKTLYDRLRAGEAGPVRDHLRADPEFQRKSARFLENHDEPRAADVFAPEMHRAAAVVGLLAPGLRFFHDGQLEGGKVRVPIQLCRRPDEAPDVALGDFYERLLECLKRPALRAGDWQLLDCRPAWDVNVSAQQFIAYAWEGQKSRRVLIAVNYAGSPGQCYVTLPLPDLSGRKFVLRDLLSPIRYERSGDDLAARGLYLDLPAWGHHVFEMSC
jgi:hypothetical protein